MSARTAANQRRWGMGRLLSIYRSVDRSIDLYDLSIYLTRPGLLPAGQHTVQRRADAVREARADPRVADADAQSDLLRGRLWQVGRQAFLQVHRIQLAGRLV